MTSTIRLFVLAVLVLSAGAHAGLIRVSQESAAGAGDFDANVLGVIESFVPTPATLTVAQFYQYGSGGSTNTRWILAGDTAVQVQADDPGEAVVVSAGGTQFDSVKNWASCCTDGYALGSLDGNWSMIGQFRSSPVGITRWQATSADGADIGLVLEAGRRARFDLVTPEPGTLGVVAAGLLGLGLVRRRR